MLLRNAFCLSGSACSQDPQVIYVLIKVGKHWFKRQIFLLPPTFLMKKKSFYSEHSQAILLATAQFPQRQSSGWASWRYCLWCLAMPVAGSILGILGPSWLYVCWACLWTSVLLSRRFLSIAMGGLCGSLLWNSSSLRTRFFNFDSQLSDNAWYIAENQNIFLKLSLHPHHEPYGMSNSFREQRS